LENTLKGGGAKKDEGEPKKKKPPMAPKLFGDAGRDHMKKYDTTKEHFAKISIKNHQHSTNNPLSQYQDPCTMDEVFESKMIYDPLTVLQCCPTSDGSAAAILVSEEFLEKNPDLKPLTKVLSMQMTTDKMKDFSRGPIGMVGYGMTESGAQQLYDEAGKGPEDVQVIELHDCFSTNELITYEGLQLTKEGQGAELVESGNNTYGGKWVINPSGGLLSKGHPLGATGLAQLYEISKQLTGQAEKRQVEGAKVGLTHNLGLGGACVVGMYEKA